MPVHPPPHKQRSAVFRQKSAEPGLPIDLNSSTRSTDGDTGHKITRRAFLIDLVVDKPGRETADLLAHLGSPLEPLTTLPIPPTAPTSVVETDAAPRHLHEDATQRLDNLIEELVRTEKSYLSRIHALKTLIPPYEAKAMFANIEAIVPASAAFLTDLDAMFQCGRAAEEIGDLKTLRTLDPYRTYLSKQDESQRLFQESLRKFPGFASFIERPRLLEAIEIASRIARCEPDPQTVRATVMHHLERNIEDFPAKLFSNSRDFIDAIDVEDQPAEYPSSPSRPSSTVGSRPLSFVSGSTPSLGSFGSLSSSTHSPTSNLSHLSPLPCTLFLFNDKLVIVKRQSGALSGRKITGTDDVKRLVTSNSTIEKGTKKDKLSFRGEVDVLDVIATDVGNGVHRFGIFKFRTGTLSCPTTPSSHRLRPSMLNLDAISRNLFGAGSVSIRGDAFSPSSKRRSQSIERSFEIESPLEDPLGLIAGAPYAIEMHQSEVDLNERLTEAKANSRSVASNAAVERAPESPIPITAPLRLCKTPPPVATLSPPQAQTPLALTIKPLPPAKDEWPIPTPQSPPVVTRPSGPRLAPQSPPPALSSSAPIGSAHTKLRIVSGGGRRISVGRETVPLKGGDENESPTSTPTIHVAAKRQHSSDHLTPRKRSPTRSPLQPLPPHELPDQQLSARHSSNRRSPGTLTPGRYVTAPRTASQTSTDLVDIEMADHPDLESAMQASSKKRIADHDAFDSVSSRHSGRHEIDTIVMDECARGITSIAERVEANLRQAQADGLQASSLVSRLLAERDQIELDVIYEAFNTELDGLFSDAQLPETEAFQALQDDLRSTKAQRNSLELENKRLKRELEEANLKREQWARMLRSQGFSV
ncbi:hypothetical protein IAU60_006248 [Kwoniella sp. DSM 27419]